MLTLQILFWFLLIMVFYSYVGYGLLLYILVALKRLFSKNKPEINSEETEVTLFIAAFNEIDYVEEKVKNSVLLNYPKEKLHFLWVTDGSNDGTPELLSTYNNITVLHNSERAGKINAINRGMKTIKTPIVVFCDANTMLSQNSIKEIVRAFDDPIVGCVAGEKRIFDKSVDSAAGSGEGIYWKYESFLKKMDSEFYTTVGAAGELFAIRTELFNEVEPDTLLDDFIMSMRIAINGNLIKYVPQAYAYESSSANVKEELKRKVRIAAGAVQSTFRLTKALNPFHDFRLTFQFVSHKISRWLIVPFALPLLFIINLLLVYFDGYNQLTVYSVLFLLQLLYYIITLLGWIMQSMNIKLKILFVPYYIFMMNYASWLGLFRYIKGNQSVNWERAKRSS
ncbi:MAG: glycosyltransferase family 2 protein [Bacteroidia bacterium]|nr:glycosyltransferase family 2 protein [Bacteroidia bacterium]